MVRDLANRTQARARGWLPPRLPPRAMRDMSLKTGETDETLRVPVRRLPPQLPPQKMFDLSPKTGIADDSQLIAGWWLPLQTLRDLSLNTCPPSRCAYPR